MVPRIAAVTIGLIGAVAAAVILTLHSTAALTWLGVDQPAIVSALALPLPRAAWIVAVSVGVFATFALLIALAAGFVETLIARSRVDALRHDPQMAGRWNAADWRAAFAHTAVAERAEAIVATGATGGATAGAPPRASGDAPRDEAASNRRIVADLSLLIGLDRVWLDRMALDRTIAPLPVILLGLGATFALLQYGGGEPGWEIAAAGGVAGAAYVASFRYLVRSFLGPVVELVTRSATASVRPLTPALSVDLIARRAGDLPATLGEPVSVQADPQQVAALTSLAATLPPLVEQLSMAANQLGEAGSGLSQQIANQMGAQIAEIAARAGENGGLAAAAPLAAIAEGIRGAVQQREQAIESALAEVREGIESLLASPSPVQTQSSESADSIRQAIVEQGEALQRVTTEFAGGLDGVATSLQTTLASIEATERQNAGMLADLLNAIEALSAPGVSLARPAAPIGQGTAPESNAAVADALRNLLREFDES